MLKIKLRGVASTQKFEENQQSVKSDDDYDISFTFVPFCDVRVIVRSCMHKQTIRNKLSETAVPVAAMISIFEALVLVLREG